MLQQKTRQSLILTVIAAIGGVMVVAQQPGTGIFTTAQAEAGRTAFQANCAECHRPDLRRELRSATARGRQLLQRMARAAGPGIGEPHSRHHASRQPRRGRGTGGRHHRRVSSPVKRCVGGHADARGCYSRAHRLGGDWPGLSPHSRLPRDRLQRQVLRKSLAASPSPAKCPIMFPSPMRCCAILLRATG